MTVYTYIWFIEIVIFTRRNEPLPQVVVLFIYLIHWYFHQPESLNCLSLNVIKEDMCRFICCILVFTQIYCQHVLLL